MSITTNTKELDMDPNAAQRRIDEAKRAGDKAEEREARRDLAEWRRKGGFAPGKR